MLNSLTVFMENTMILKNIFFTIIATIFLSSFCTLCMELKKTYEEISQICSEQEDRNCISHSIVESLVLKKRLDCIINKTTIIFDGNTKHVTFLKQSEDKIRIPYAILQALFKQDSEDEDSSYYYNDEYQIGHCVYNEQGKYVRPDSAKVIRREKSFFNDEVN